LLDFFYKNKLLLETSTKTKDKIKIALYEKLQKQFNEYFSALNNYKQYESENDISIKIDTIQE